MKRPTGFDRSPTRSRDSEVSSPSESEESADAASEASVVSPTRPPREATAPPSARSQDPAYLPRDDAPSAAERRDAARGARRSARRAALARRSVERTEVRRFTRRTRHRRAALITVAAVVVALVASVTISVFSPLLSLETITVSGTSRVDREAVLASLDDQIGKPLALVDFGAIKTDLSDFPLIESYVTETKPPHTLVIRVTEREPIATVKVGSSFELVDPAGVIIATSTKQAAGYPVVDIRGSTVDGDVYRSAAEVLLALPAQLRKAVSSVTASTADDVTLKLDSGAQVVWGSADSSDRKAVLLTGLIKDHTARDPSQAVEYDVSAPENGIIRTK